MKAFDFSKRANLQESDISEDKEASYLEFFPKTIYNVSRSNQDSINSSAHRNDCPFFSEEIREYLPNAMVSSYKGDKSDLVSFSFLAK